MNILLKIRPYKRMIDTYIRLFFDDQIVKYQENKIISRLLNELKETCVLGKSIRGSLILYLINLYDQQITKDIIKIASAIELFHTSFLIHDDIIDNDFKRRGKPSIHALYLDSHDTTSNKNKTAESMGINIGDIGFFLAYQILSDLDLSEEKNNKIYKKISLIFTEVGYGQAEDVMFSKFGKSGEMKDIIDMYTRKTSQYTFSLPLYIATFLVGGKNVAELMLLEKLGNILGILFQLRDDELSLLKTDKTSGKPEGSDIRENKHTLIRYFLYKFSNQNQVSKISKIYGNSVVSQKNLEYIRSLYRSEKIQNQIVAYKRYLIQSSEKMISQLVYSKKITPALKAILKFVAF